MSELNDATSVDSNEACNGSLEKKDSPAKRRHIKHIMVAAKIIVSLSLLAYILHRVEPANVVETISKARANPLILAAVLFFVSNVLGSWLWSMLLSSQRVRIPFYRVASFYFVGLFFNNFLPANIGGDIVRIYDASRYCKDKSAVFIATFMDRVIGLLAISFLSVVASFYALDHFKIFLLYLTVVLGFLGSLLVVLSILNRRILALFEKPFKWVKAFDLERRVVKLFDELHSFRDRLPLLVAVLSLAIGIQLLRVYVHYLVARSLGINISLSYFFLFVPVLAALSALPISINGLGVREGAGVVLFGLAHVARGPAFLIEFITYLIGVAISLTGGVIFLLRTPFEILRRHNASAAPQSPTSNSIDRRS
ncbi:MAG: lysylphosphatidylglycerol synthase transmembrane domain-containing protein [Candidatus Eisenbacteria bacterium]|nr:lysylphosphatidylglycerol synthase transmembrane domain-containing protein [Candidatus Eisenbacteria bacterium]